MNEKLKKYSQQLAGLGLAVMTMTPLAALAQVSVLKSNMQTAAGSLGTGTNDANALPTLIGKGIDVVLGFLGVILVLLIIYGGWLWMTAAGDKTKVDKAKQIIYQAIIGLIIIFAAYAIASFVISSLSTTTGVS